MVIALACVAASRHEVRHISETMRLELGISSPHRGCSARLSTAYLLDFTDDNHCEMPSQLLTQGLPKRFSRRVESYGLTAGACVGPKRRCQANRNANATLGDLQRRDQMRCDICDVRERTLVPISKSYIPLLRYRSIHSIARPIDCSRATL
jgi:hypothetical protein